MENLLDELIQNPIIPAVRDKAILESALNSECRVIFLLHSTILTIRDEISMIKQKNKLVFVHIDLIEGVGKDEKGIEFLKSIGADGIISTRQNLINHAFSLSLPCVQRIFLIDSQSISSGLKMIENSKPTFVEVLPGVIPKAIYKLSQNTQIPIIAGGMIESKEEVIEALGAGAVAISTSNSNLFSLL
ncbi:glycerol-3-phosphate responsive antiterminator [Caldicellulosiruptor naganoensis]|uniref:Glycerol-3-phosphate responsive antiterminator n=1 Tax=Caldicellulosiruptor naganoensis TaxID=29324 RepID=A0ABY7BHB1_9FIRM|nr:glycerol-3-phosphate responsive antiterminator [Caldicellulosiruptor naganoensis]WAM30981.1 glycerol-3-phosphate responsive antiterminator [Caldicellulosiruptor naganoensis]